MNCCRLFQIAGIKVRIEGDLDFDRVSFKKELMDFSITKTDAIDLNIHHWFGIPDLKDIDLGLKIYEKAPWAIYKKMNYWNFVGILPEDGKKSLWTFAVFNSDFSQLDIYNPIENQERLYRDGFHSLSLFPTDQVWLCPMLPDRHAVLLHSGAAMVNQRGMVFVGHSDAGKSTTMELLKSARDRNGLDVEILCDDRNVIRKWGDVWRVHGTWSHGTTADVSPSSAPLAGIFFLEQSKSNQIIPLEDKSEIRSRLLETVIRSMVTHEWWKKEIDIIEEIIAEVPTYRMLFDKSGAILEKIVQLRR